MKVTYEDIEYEVGVNIDSGAIEFLCYKDGKMVKGLVFAIPSADEFERLPKVARFKCEVEE